MKVFDKVSCVVDTHKDERVSQFYTRLGDADRKARQMNQYQKDHRYLAKEFYLVSLGELDADQNSQVQ